MLSSSAGMRILALTRHPAGARLIWIRFGNCTNADLLSRIEAVWVEVEKRLAEGEVLIELRPDG